MRLLIFFPSITFSIISAEIFPWALIYALTKFKALNYKLLVIAIIIAVSSLYVTIRFDGYYLSETIRSAAAYINPLMIFFVLLRIDESEVFKLNRLLQSVLIGLFILGILQYFSLLSFAEPLIQFLVPRGSGDLLSSIRGVTLLSSEPSRASTEYVFLYAAWRSMAKASPQKLLILDMLIAFFIILIIKSAIGAVMVLLIMTMYYKFKNRKRKFKH